MKTYKVENLISYANFYLVWSLWRCKSLPIPIHQPQNMCSEITDDLPIRTSIFNPMFEVKQSHFTQEKIEMNIGFNTAKIRLKKLKI